MRARPMLLFILPASACLAVPVLAADDVQERAVPNAPLMQRTSPAIPAPTMNQKVALLQPQVQTLQAQVAALQSVLIVTAAGTTIKTFGSALVEVKGALDLKGPVIKLNGGAKPVATVGSAVGNGKVLTGSSTILGN